MTVFLFAVIASIVTLDPDTGRLSAFRHSFENRYLLMEKGKPDVTALERDDVVVKRTVGEDFVSFRCENPKMPGVTVEKRYVVDRARASVRRTLTFCNSTGQSKYVTPYVD